VLLILLPRRRLLLVVHIMSRHGSQPEIRLNGQLSPQDIIGDPSAHHSSDKPSAAASEAPYSAFTRKGKWTIVILVSFASFFRSRAMSLCWS
jgi:hypothetical protein